MAAYHQGPRPETLERVARDRMSYEVIVRDGYANGMVALLVKPEIVPSQVIPTMLQLLYRTYPQGPVCCVQLDIDDPRAWGGDNREDMPLAQHHLLRHRSEVGPHEPIFSCRLLFDPREEGSRLLLTALASADQYVVAYYDAQMICQATKGYRLASPFNAAAQSILKTTVLQTLDDQAVAAWQEAKERFLLDFPLAS